MKEKVETLNIFSKEDKEFILQLIDKYEQSADKEIKSQVLKIINLYSYPFMQVVCENDRTTAVHATLKRRITANVV